MNIFYPSKIRISAATKTYKSYKTNRQLLSKNQLFAGINFTFYSENDTGFWSIFKYQLINQSRYGNYKRGGT